MYQQCKCIVRNYVNLKMWEQTKEMATAKTSKYFEICISLTENKGGKCKQERMKNKDTEKNSNLFEVTLKIDKQGILWIKIIPENSEPNFI